LQPIVFSYIGAFRSFVAGTRFILVSNLQQ
jgi:hypothetical protein